MLERTMLFFVIELGVLTTLTRTTPRYVGAGNEWNASCRDLGYDAGRGGPSSQ
jgi:hypothetical protein